MPISNTSPQVQLWTTGAGGGHGLFSVNGDPASNAGMTGFELTQFYQNTSDSPGTPAVAEGLYRPSDMVFDTVHGKFFIADSDLAGHNRILQGNIADLLAGNPPALTVLYEDTGAGAGTRIDNLEIDPNNGLVYFTHGDNLEKILYDVAGQTPVLLFNSNVTAGTSPSGVANPAGSTNNFFNDMVINFATGEIYLSSTRAIAGGGGDVVSKNFIYQLTGLTAASGTNAFTFGVANSGTARLLVVSPNDDTYNPNPGTTASPAIPANEPYFFPVEYGSIDGLALDAATNTLYFSTGSILFDHDQNSGTAPIVSRGGIFSYALTGNPLGVYTQIFQQNALNGPQGLLGDLEIDPTTGRWYVTDFTGGTAGAGDEGIWTGNLNGTGTPSLFSLVNDASGQIPSGFTLNIAPTLTGTETGAAATEGPGPGSGFSPGVFGLAAVDSNDHENADQTDQLAGAMVRISAGFGSSPGSNEQLTINGTTSGTLPSGIAYSYNSMTGVMTLTGIDSFADYEAALSLVAYSIDGDNPDNFGASTSRTLSYSVFDGLLLSDEYDTVITIADTNDAPVNTTGGAVAADEDDAAVPVTGLSVSDVDDSSLTVTLAVGNGTLTLASTAGLSFATGDGTADATMTFSGTIAAINAALGGLSYTPAPNFNGPDTLTMTSDDGNDQDVDIVAINVAPVNDAPQGADNVRTINEDSSYVFTVGDFGFSDPVEGDGFAGVVITTLPAAGTLFLNSVPIAAGTFVSAAQVALGELTYSPAPDGNGMAYASFTFQVRDDGGISNGGVDTDPTPNTFTFDVTADNDEPVNTVPGAVAASEDASIAIAGLSVSDVDSAALTVTFAVGRGTLAVNTGVAGGVGPGQVSGNGTGSVTVTGTQSEINTTLAAANGLTYTPTPNVNGPDTLTMTSDDGTDQDVDMVAVNVAAVNDAPTVAGDGTEDAAPIVQDMPSPVGQSVASLFGGQYSDAADQVAGGSSADPFAGVAVTANGSNPAQGQWQYFNGSSWVNIGPASDGAAVLLSASTSVRFNPAAGFFGTAPTLGVHLVDASGGALSSGTIVNASVTGGITRYSTGTVVLSQTVIAGNTPPTGVTGTLVTNEDAVNNSFVGTVVAADPDSSTFTYSLVNDAGGRFNITAGGVVTVENGLLLDYEQATSHTIRVRVDDNEGGISEFDMNVTVNDVHGEFVTGDGFNNVFYGGVETDFLFGGGGADEIHGGGGIDIITGGTGIFDPGDAGDLLFGDGGSDIIDGNGGNDIIAGGADGDILVGAEGNDTIYGGSSASDTTETGSDVISGDAGNDFLYGNGGNDIIYGGNDNDELYGGAGSDDLDGGSGVDRLDGGAGADDLTGGSGFDVFVFKKGQANGDEIMDFDGNGSGAGDTIRLEGYAAGTTFTRVSGDTWRINDHGFIEFVTIHADGNVHSSDWGFFP